MKQLINTLKQKPRHGGVPRGTQLGPVTIPTTTGQTNASAVTEQVQQLAQQLANEMFANAQATQLLARNGRVFTRFDMQNDVVSNQTEVVTAGLWSDGLAGLTTYATSSTQTTTQRRYYTDVYQENPTNEGAAVQFSLAFGHALGSGSDSQGQLNDSPSKAI